MCVPYPVGSRTGGSRAPDPARMLRQTWIIWGALLGGQVFFASVVLFMLGTRTPSADPTELTELMQWIALGLVVVEVPVGLLVRSVLWSKGRRGDAVAPQAWFAGNIVLWAMMEGAGLFGLVTVMLGGTGGLRLAAPALAFVVQVLTRPGTSSDLLATSSDDFRAE